MFKPTHFFKTAAVISIIAQGSFAKASHDLQESSQIVSWALAQPANHQFFPYTRGVAEDSLLQAQGILKSLTDQNIELSRHNENAVDFFTSLVAPYFEQARPIQGNYLLYSLKYNLCYERWVVENSDMIAGVIPQSTQATSHDLESMLDHSLSLAINSYEARSTTFPRYVYAIINHPSFDKQGYQNRVITAFSSASAQSLQNPEVVLKLGRLICMFPYVLNDGDPLFNAAKEFLSGKGSVTLSSEAKQALSAAFFANPFLDLTKPETLATMKALMSSNYINVDAGVAQQMLDLRTSLDKAI